MREAWRRYTLRGRGIVDECDASFDGDNDDGWMANQTRMGR